VKTPTVEETIKVATSKYVSSRTSKILIIEDEENVLEVMQRLLMRKGYSCDGVTNGMDGLNCIKNSHYDLIICDLRMPGMSGIELFQEVEKINPELGQRFIFTTGDNVSEGNQNFLKLTGAMVLQKPFEMDTLIAVVNKKLSNPD
jgi:DNA-binding NtrC family response regulator